MAVDIDERERAAIDAELTSLALAYGMSAEGKKGLVQVVIDWLRDPQSGRYVSHSELIEGRELAQAFFDATEGDSGDRELETGWAVSEWAKGLIA